MCLTNNFGNMHTNAAIRGRSVLRRRHCALRCGWLCSTTFVTAPPPPPFSSFSSFSRFSTFSGCSGCSGCSGYSSFRSFSTFRNVDGFVCIVCIVVTTPPPSALVPLWRGSRWCPRRTLKQHRNMKQMSRQEYKQTTTNNHKQTNNPKLTTTNQQPQINRNTANHTGAFFFSLPPHSPATHGCPCVWSHC